jgi:hypothetical protein
MAKINISDAGHSFYINRIRTLPPAEPTSPEREKKEEDEYDQAINSLMREACMGYEPDWDAIDAIREARNPDSYPL